MKGMPPKLYSRAKFVWRYFSGSVGVGVHHRVVDGGAVDAQPAEQIVVLLIKGGVFRQHHRLCRLWLRGGGGFLGGLGGLGFRRRGLRGDGRGVFLHHLGELAEIAAGFAHVNQDGGHRDQRDTEDGHQNDEKGGFPPGIAGAPGRGGAAGGLESALFVSHVSFLSMRDAGGVPRERAVTGIPSPPFPLFQKFDVFGFNPVFSCGR